MNHPDLEYKIIDYDDYDQFIVAIIEAKELAGWFELEPEKSYMDIQNNRRYRKKLFRRKYDPTGVFHIRECVVDEKTVYHVVRPDGYIANNFDHPTQENAERHLRNICG